MFLRSLAEQPKASGDWSKVRFQKSQIPARRGLDRSQSPAIVGAICATSPTSQVNCLDLLKQVRFTNLVFAELRSNCAS